MEDLGRKLKHRELEKKILTLIKSEKLRPGDAIFGERALCIRFDVSRNTVRSAIESLTSSGVLESIPGKGTFVKVQNSENKATLSVGVMIPVMDYFYPALVQGAERAFRHAGIRPVLLSCEQDPALELEEIKKLLEENSVSGLLIGPSSRCDFTGLLESSGKTPVVFVDYAPEKLNCDCVLSDNFRGGYDAAAALISRGHKRIACAGSPDETGPWVRERARGFMECLKDYGQLYDPELIRRGKWFEICPDSEFKDFFSSKNAPTAIFSTNDRIAGTVMARLREASFSVPDDVSVLGYDNESFCDTLRPALASMAVPKEEIGIRAAGLLIERMNSELVIPPRRMTLAPVLVERASLNKFR